MKNGMHIIARNGIFIQHFQDISFILSRYFLSVSCQSLSVSKWCNLLIHNAPVSLTVYFAFFER